MICAVERFSSEFSSIPLDLHVKFNGTLPTTNELESVAAVGGSG
jgi:hypothetical protein